MQPGDWCEPWVERFVADLDLRRGLNRAGLPVKPIDPDRLPGPAIKVLMTWGIERLQQQAAAESTAESPG